MFSSIAGLALALQLGTATDARAESIPPIGEIRYRGHGRPPPCDQGWDLNERDGKCYPNRAAPQRTLLDRYYPLEYGGGRRPVPCGHGADADIRDGLCYPTGTVPRQYQQGRAGYHHRRNGYYEMR